MKVLDRVITDPCSRYMAGRAGTIVRIFEAAGGREAHALVDFGPDPAKFGPDSEKGRDIWDFNLTMLTLVEQGLPNSDFIDSSLIGRKDWNLDDVLGFLIARGCEMGQDNDGQIVLHTGLWINEDGRLTTQEPA